MSLAPIFLTYALLHVGIRLLALGAVEHDEAEQVLLSQALALGYGKHPPVYAWLQHAVFQLLGVGVLGLAVLKHACLLGIYGGTYWAARSVQRKVVRLAALDRDFVTAECLDYDPLGPALGFLAPEAQPATRSRLGNRLRQIYGARVSALLGLAFGETR